MIAWGQSIDEVARAHHVPLELAGLWLAVLADRLGLAAEGSRRADDELVCEIGQNLFFDHEAPDVLTRLRAGGDVRVWAEAVRVTGDADGVARALGVPVGELLDAVAPHLAGAAWEFWLEETRRTHVVPVPPAVQVIEPPVDHAELTIPLHIDVDMLELLHTEPDLPDDETMFPAVVEAGPDAASDPDVPAGLHGVAADAGADDGLHLLQYFAAVWVHAGLDPNDFDVIDRRTNGELMQRCLTVYAESLLGLPPAGEAALDDALAHRFVQLHRHFASHLSEE